MGEPGSLLLNVFIYLLVALLAVPGAKWLGLGPVLGYLLAGVFIGPWGLALIREADHIRLFSGFGTVLLLLLVALQATPARLKQLKSNLFSPGILPFCLTIVAVMVIALIIGLPWHHSLLAALALSLSSGAIASQIFRERYPTGSPLTDTGRRLLLTQSIAMVPILVFVPLLGFEAAVTIGSAWPDVITSIVVIVVFSVAGHLLLRYAFRHVVNVGLDEVFAAFALLLVIGTLLMMQAFDLPMELGALLAGLLLARSEYGSAISIAIHPFRGLLIGMFFITVGMAIDFATFIWRPLETLALVTALVILKAWILRSLLRSSAVPRRQRIWLATVLSQSGELAFVVITFGVTYYAIPEKLGSQLTLVVALSMMTTPILLIFADRRDEIPAPQQNNTGLSTGDLADSQVVIAGYGRMGRVVARLLQRNGFRTAIIDHNPERFGELRAEQFVGFYGDALRPDLLKRAGAGRAAVIVIAIDDSERAAELVRRVRRDYPHLLIVSRAVDHADHASLIDGGADRAYPETFESALLMGEDVLELVGLSPLDAQALTESFRDAEG